MSSLNLRLGNKDYFNILPEDMEIHKVNTGHTDIDLYYEITEEFYNYQLRYEDYK